MDEKTKIVFLSRYQNNVFRGVESYVYELSKRLGTDFEVDVFSGKDADSLKKVLGGKYNYVIPTNGRLQALKMGGGRVIDGYKTVIVGHAGIGKDDIWNLAGTFPNIFVALTQKQLKWAKKWAWNSKVVKIPHGIDLKRFSSTGKKADINLEHPIILSVGALEWYKYHDLVIKAVSRLLKGSLLIIGKGAEKEKLQNLGKNLLGEKRFKILNVDYDEIPNFYRAADLFTLPSWDREAFGIVYLEALATNLAVVAPDDESRKEIVGDAGILFDVNDVNKYVAALAQALNMKWENKPRTQAEKFSWDIIAEKYKKLFFENLI